MKSLNIYAALLVSLFAINFSFAQTSIKKETIKVWGNCGMCKKKIETAAKNAGATYANWNEHTNFLKISYDPLKSNSQSIQKSIAATGYDTQGFNASDSAYAHLDDCCKYARKKINNTN